MNTWKESKAVNLIDVSEKKLDGDNFSTAQVMEMHIKLAKYYFFKANYKQAITNIESAWELTTDKDQLTALRQLKIKVLIKTGKYNDACNLAKELDLHKDDLIAARSLEILGDLKLVSSAYQEAKKYYEKALKIRTEQKNTTEADQLDLAECLNKNATTLAYLGDLKGAKTKHEEELGIKAKIYKTRDVAAIADTIHYLGNIAFRSKEFKEAESHYAEALGIREKVFKTEPHPDVAASLFVLGEVEKKKEHYGSARNYYERALTMRMAVYKTPKHLSVLVCQLRLGELFIINGQVDQGKKILEEGYKILDEIFPLKQDNLHGDFLMWLGVIDFLNNELDNSKVKRQHALDIYRLNHLSSDDIAESENRLNSIMLKLKDKAPITATTGISAASASQARAPIMMNDAKSLFEPQPEAHMTTSITSMLSSASRDHKHTTDVIWAQQGTFPLLLTVPHGGKLDVPNTAPRKEGIIRADSGTFELVEMINATLLQLNIKPYIVAARFKRKYIDTNRPANQAFDQKDSTQVSAIYEAYHKQIKDFVQKLKGTDNALLIDIHGQGKSLPTIFRGTQNGKTIQQLLKRGKEHLVGPKGILGSLTVAGNLVIPSSTDFLNDKENPHYNGGFTVRTYGSHNKDGIDAIQLELGGYQLYEDKSLFVYDFVCAILNFFRNGPTESDLATLNKLLLAPRIIEKNSMKELKNSEEVLAFFLGQKVSKVVLPFLPEDNFCQQKPK